jgi:CubicO group peptidase (beta-lactamase class C family)|tara:strand:+ start:4516 stop:5760 length:1245 start_codon:yes stop_codon:yes gene_type:complete
MKVIHFKVSAVRFVFIILFGLLNTSSFAEIEQARLDAIEKDLQTRIDEDKLSGAVVMIAQNGEIEMTKALGYQNVEDQIPMRNDTIFRIFSMTKPVTGTALMTLYDEGRFSLDDPIEKHMPELAGLSVAVSANDDGTWETEPANHPMTIRELMSHTGGLLYFPPLGNGAIAEAYVEAGIGGNATLADSIPQLSDIPLDYQPGTKWVYSISVDVQGYLIERLSGQKLDEFFKERIFDPLGMSDTAFFVSSDKLNRFSRMYAPANGTLVRTDNLGSGLGGSFTEKPMFLAGGHGLTSTAADYMKFAQMHLNKGILNGKRILSENAVSLMRSNQLPTNVPEIGQPYPGNVFGLDFAVVENPEIFQGAPAGTHWWWGIAGSWFWVDPVTETVFIGMIQNNDILLSLQIHRAARSAMYE